MNLFVHVKSHQVNYVMVLHYDASFRYSVEGSTTFCDGFNSQPNVPVYLDSREYADLPYHFLGMDHL